MKVFLVECVCPDGHGICGVPLELPAGLTDDAYRAELQKFYRAMKNDLAQRIAAGAEPPHCETCGAPWTKWEFQAREAPEGVTLKDVITLLEKRSVSATEITVEDPEKYN